MRSHSFKLVPLFLLFGSTTVIQASSKEIPGKLLNEETDAFINQVLTEWNSTGGISVAVVRKNDQGAWNVETKGYGRAKADGSKVTEKTLFGIASNSKLFTIAATGLLINNSTLSPRLSWTTKIASIIPNWALMDPIASNQANILDVMSHRTGLPRHDLMYKETENVTDILQKMKYLRPSAEFRDIWQYSNMMYILLSSLPKLLLPSKTPFTQYVKQHIFDPLGLTATTYSFEKANASGQLADGLTWQGGNTRENPFSNGTLRVLPFFSTKGGEDGNALAGPGGIISNAVDMATWLQTLLLNGVKPGSDQVIIPADVLDQVSTGISIQTPTAQFPELSPVVYGGGLARSTYRGHEMLEHGGNVPGHNSQITRLQNDNIGVALLSNDNILGGFIVETIKARILDDALGLERIDWSNRYKQAVIQAAGSAPVPISRPANTTLPTKGFAGLAGIYNSPAYGKLELCLVSPPNATSSASCKALASDIPRILPGAIDPAVPTFLVKIDSPWATHLRISHFNGNFFNLTILRSTPTGEAAAPFWTFDPDLLNARSAETGDGGIGLRNVWGIGDIPSPLGNTVRERAEAWFDKI